LISRPVGSAIKVGHINEIEITAIHQVNGVKLDRCSQTRFDISETLSIRELRKGEGKKLIPARESRKRREQSPSVERKSFCRNSSISSFHKGVEVWLWINLKVTSINRLLAIKSFVFKMLQRISIPTLGQH
jgi:hypothetical protein